MSSSDEELIPFPYPEEVPESESDSSSLTMMIKRDLRELVATKKLSSLIALLEKDQTSSAEALLTKLTKISEEQKMNAKL